MGIDVSLISLSISTTANGVNLEFAVEGGNVITESHIDQFHFNTIFDSDLNQFTAGNSSFWGYSVYSYDINTISSYGVDWMTAFGVALGDSNLDLKNDIQVTYTTGADGGIIIGFYTLGNYNEILSSGGFVNSFETEVGNNPTLSIFTTTTTTSAVETTFNPGNF